MLAVDAVLTRLASDGKLWLRQTFCTTGKAETQELRTRRKAELSLLEEAAVRFVLLSTFSWGRVILSFMTTHIAGFDSWAFLFHLLPT